MARPPGASERGDAFAGFDLRAAVAALAEARGLSLSADALGSIEAQARAVAEAAPTLGLTAIRDPREFVERHVGEALSGAVMLPAGVEGPLLDLGSGNGYPGLPLASARPLLEPFLVEAQSRKARFLRALINAHVGRGAVIERQVQRAGDLEELAPLRVLVTRAMGGWEKIVPRLVPALRLDADVLIWAGGETERIAARAAWRRLRLAGRHPLEGRDRSWIWRFTPAGAPDAPRSTSGGA